MHEIHSMGGDRSFRPHHHHHHHHHQALKCPRCDSINTKFCYYNNYHLSQPRHFCKTCRRYWTKGGVLRNVPVGGGCRKSKPSNNNSSSETETTTAATEHNSNSHSSSESSSLTLATEAVSAPKTFNSDSNNNNDSKSFTPFSNPAFETGALEHQQQQGTEDCAIFSEIGSFTRSITSTNDTLQFGFGVTTIPDAGLLMSMDGGDDVELKFPDNLNGGGASLLEQGTIPVDLTGLQNKTGHGGFGPLDWHGDGDQGLFDLSNTVDYADWTHQTTHWCDHDNSSPFHLP
ncbi:hypothetical protein TanjilG_26303 [Lupinus angustifolius]|uniref:Dof zinc finger protein n=1 Tax=Lupinus angustifolius TaxID=3871 RepID=A0A4P1R2F5_LUPAN|nr:PREDICTED: dof zinc finger protein DOF5.4-like [Lupinus angustifolius]OIV99965.1 hypothetical protein TanjilG_26303 [Lupinus angustifolius]